MEYFWQLFFAFSIPTSDNEQKLVYKRILRGGEIPSNGLQKHSQNNCHVQAHGIQIQLLRVWFLGPFDDSCNGQSVD